MTQEQQHKINNTYKGKRVFLTGHTGFKGAWMLYWLHELGATVKGYALASQSPNDLYVQINGDGLCESIIADIRDRERVIQEIIDFQPDFVFHLAAQPLVRRSYQIPAETMAVNSLGTAHVLDAIQALEKPCVGIMITTDKVYENKETHRPYSENDRLGGYDPYSASKACAELIISSYRNSFFNPSSYDRHQKAVASARSGNVIGGGDWSKDRIIPDIVRALQKGEAVQVRNPTAIRPWQHVLEPIGGYLLLGVHLVSDPIKFSKGWNFGPLTDDHLTVGELADSAINIWGIGSRETEIEKISVHEAGLLTLDISLAQSELFWEPKWDSKTAIEATMKWYKHFQQRNGTAVKLVANDFMEYMIPSNEVGY